MPLKKLLLKSGTNQENTRYTSENGWYEGDKIRFRQGTPEKIGGWELISTNTFLGVCRSLKNWVTLTGRNLIGLGTSLKFYVSLGGAYYDVTPIRGTSTLTNPFATSSGLPTVVVTDVAHGAISGDFVTFSGATAVGGLTLNGEYQITFITVDTYSITASSNASSNATGGGTVTAEYQINTGPSITVPLQGWGVGPWGFGTWGFGQAQPDQLRIWNQAAFGENLIFGPRGGGLYYWYGSGVMTTRGVDLSSLPGASDVPVKCNNLLTSDVSRFVLALGCNDYGSTDLDPLLIRWSDQESAVMWTPAITNQAGSIRLSQGSTIVSVQQSRQEILVWTDTAFYSLQYQGPPYVWGASLLGDNTSIASPNATVVASGITYWMGDGKFYKYDGRVQTLRCDLRQYIFTDFNTAQYDQVFCGTNEEFNEVWWFYCSANSTTIDRYVVYNYLEDIWYYGTMARTAWIDSDVSSNPIAASYNGRLVYQEYGLNDNESGTPQPIESYILSSEFDIDDGHNFSFIWRILPDITFRGSADGASPQVTMTLFPLNNSGSGYTDPASVGGSSYANVTRTAVLPIEEFTGQIYVRVRGRQMAIKIHQNQLDATWQLGSPRLDVRPDGRR